jgi:hypothetical protein
MADTMEERLHAAADKIKAVAAAREAAALQRADEVQREEERVMQLKAQGEQLAILLNNKVIDQSAALARTGSHDRLTVGREEPGNAIVAFLVRVTLGGPNPRGRLGSPELRITLHRSGALIATWPGPGRPDLPADRVNIDQQQPINDQFAELIVQLYERVAAAAA